MSTENQGNYRIRPMTRADIPAVAELERAYFSIPWTETCLEESFDSGYYLFLVAEAAGGIVGYGGMLMSFDEGDITNIVVSESVRGKGIGTELTKNLVNEGERLGLSAFTLEVRVSNRKAIHIYEKLGFLSEGIRKGFYEKPIEDAMIMWKRKPEQ